MYLKAQYRTLIGVLFLFCVPSLTAQVKYEAGYYLNSAGEKVVGMIGNELWGMAPEQILFINEQGQESVIHQAEMTEFSIDGKVKFVKANVPIDTSTNMLNLSSEIAQPLFDTQSVFLFIHIEGESTLAEYLWKGHSRYFLSMDQGKSFIPLVYKKYHPNEYESRENNQFRQQLLENLSDSGIKIEDVANLRYSLREIIKLLARVNGDDSIDFSTGSFFKERVEVGARIELTRWRLGIIKSRYQGIIGPALGGGIGTNFLIKFPYKSLTLGMSISPTIRLQNLVSDSSETPLYRIRYFSVDFPVGGRVLLSVTPSTRLFFGLGYTFVFHPTLSTIFYRDGSGFSLNSRTISNNFYGELGCTYLDRYSVELSYQKRNLSLRSFGQLEMISLVFGMRLLN